MPHPTPKVEIAFNTSGTETWYENSPVWTDVTADVRSVSVSRGRSRDSERFGATNATVVLDNSDRKYDPWNTSSSYWVPAVTERINLIKNSAFTQNLDYPAYGESHFWTTYGYGSAIALADDPIGNDGNNAYTFQGVGMSGFTTTADAAAVTVGQSYYGSMYVRQTNGTPLRVAQARIVWYDSIGNILSTTSGATITLTAVFQRVSVNGAAPVSAATASLQLYFVDSWYADQYQVMYPLLEQSSTLQPVFQRSDNAEGAWGYYAPLYFNGSVRYGVDAYSLLKPRLQIRVTADPDGNGYVPVWRGWISGFPVKYTDVGHNSTVTLDCYDGYAAIANYAITPDMSEKAFGSVLTRFNEPQGATQMRGRIASLGGYQPVVFSQVGGTTPMTKYDPLAPNVHHQSTNLGWGNTWRSTDSVRWPPDLVTISPILAGQGISLWWAGNNPSADSTFAVFRWEGELELTMLSTGYLRARYWNGGSYSERQSSVNGLNNFVPHHVAVHILSGELRIYVDGQNVSGATSSGSGTNPYASITGECFLQVANDIVQDMSTAYYRLSPSPASTWASIESANATVYGISRGLVTELSSARFTRLMQYAGLSAFRYANSGNASSVSVAALDKNGPVTPMLDKLVDSEGGTMFCTKDGVLRFYDQGYAFRKGSGSVAYAMGDGPADKRFAGDLEMSVSVDDMQNQVTVYFTGDGAVVATNNESVDAYGTAAQETETYIATAALAGDLASQRVAVFGSETTRMSQLELSPAISTTDWAAILALELLDKVSVAFGPLGGSTVTKNLTIQEISHEITPKIWRTSIRCSERFVGHFTLDASILDGPDKLL